MKSFSKIQFFIMAIAAILFNACNNGNQPSLDGTYINHAEGEFSIADDTLEVEHVQQRHYLIHRKTGFRIKNEAGKPGKLQQESEEWKAEYDIGSMSMTENKKARVISFDPDKGVLMLENSKYQRIN
ncbi:hypothetical protein [Pedobacter nyackensis]|uniref:NlpE N-terminal domain-containing protein n=1 Tax=Pedobacter nyackensis TaxID=475255 RepID=A0A1W2DWE1_9SPHI|nr:hypothetical protein [Pedobacter nyackensis]SMD01402.1 hypothetical protein SAMN04488101_108173 [Pedobacter nyackensis]